MNDIIGNIKKNNLKDFFHSLIIGVIVTGICFPLWFGLFAYEFSIFMFLFNICISLAAIFIDYVAIKNLKLVLNPLSSDVFKKYGSEVEIQQILNEINNNIEYQDAKIIISKDYIIGKNDIESLVACEDVLGIHKMVHKTNFVIDYYEVVITDKFNNQVTFRYLRNEEEILNNVLNILALKCKNAKLGYTNEAFEYIRENKQDLSTYDPHSK